MPLWVVGLLHPVAGMVEAELIDALRAQHSLLADAPPTSSVSRETEAAGLPVLSPRPLTLQSLLEGDSINEGSWMEKRGNQVGWGNGKPKNLSI